mgnify:CR=1 FL=1
MSIEPFNVLQAVALPITQANVDTDQILPARYLQKPRANDFGAYLFRDVRDHSGGTNNTEFVLNKPVFSSARIVVAERNFGCGSSREHAVWALQNYGFKAVISSRFADIFRGNSLKAGLLTIIVSQEEVEALWGAIESKPDTPITIDLETRTVSYNSTLLNFVIDDYTRWRLMEGLDDIGLTLKQTDSIDSFEKNRAEYKPKTLPVLK